MDMPKKVTPPEYVGFGMLTPVAIMVLENLPKRNTGAVVQEVNEFVFDDAAIVACLLRQWNVPSAMIGTAVGDDVRGHALAKQLKDWGVQGNVRFTDRYKTPIEVNVSDREGARRIFVPALEGRHARRAGLPGVDARFQGIPRERAGGLSAEG